MTTTTVSRNAAAHSARPLPDFLTRIGVTVASYITRSRAERQLEALDDRLLLDIGVSRSEIRHMVWGGSER